MADKNARTQLMQPAGRAIKISTSSYVAALEPESSHLILSSKVFSRIMPIIITILRLIPWLCMQYAVNIYACTYLLVLYT